MTEFNFPDFLYPGSKISFMTLDKPYQEFLVRWYYYDHSDEEEIPDTVPVENIEDYIAEHMNPANMWVAKGFATARMVAESKSNLDFKNDASFSIFCIYVARVWFNFAVKHEWIKPDITKKEFKERCPPFRPTYGIHL